MTTVLRKIDNKHRWNKKPEGDLAAWLKEGELPADALQDIKTNNNRLSVFLLEDEASATLERVVGALAAKRDYLAKFDYVLFSSALLAELGIEWEATLGDTSDGVVNACHRDLVKITATKLADFGTTLVRKGKVERKSVQEAGKCIGESIREKFIDSEKVPAQIVQQMQERGIR
jgi:hypothetical protein